MDSVDVRNARVLALDARPQGDLFAAGTGLEGVVFYDVKSGKRLLQIHDKRWTSPHALCFSPDGNLLAVGYADEKVRIWEMHTR